jgi:intein/homing endonuclease
MVLKQNNAWNEWFAGLVDGDGYFYINKKNEISFEMTTSSEDGDRILSHIKNKLKAGSVKLRSGSRSTRYRVKQKQTIKEIVIRLNGMLQHPKRLKQFQTVCDLLCIARLPSHTVKPSHGYLSGLFDSDGTISISVSQTSQVNSQKSGTEGKIVRLQESRGFNQVYLRITSVSESMMVFIQTSYAFGKVYREKANKKNKSPQDKYHWMIRSYEDFIRFSDYLNENPLRSVKMHRIRLVFDYFHYKKLKYHLKDSLTLEYKLWSTFCRSWFKYHDTI